MGYLEARRRLRLEPRTGRQEFQRRPPGRGSAAGGQEPEAAKKHAVQAVVDHVNLFGKAPRIYAYDRGGYSPDNVDKIADLGVKHVGVLPTGRTPSSLGPRIKKRVLQERCRIEGECAASFGEQSEPVGTSERSNALVTVLWTGRPVCRGRTGCPERSTSPTPGVQR